MLRLLKQEGIHTCLDTAGAGLGDYTEILRHTDLILYDVKHITESGYLDMTGRPMAETQAFLAEAQRLGIPLWIRHVLVPGFTDSRAHLAQLKRFVDSLQHVQRVELLPYHLLGVHKYETMQLPYSLSGVPAMDQEKAAQLQEEFSPNSPQPKGGICYGTMERICTWRLAGRNQCPQLYPEELHAVHRRRFVFAAAHRKDQKSMGQV